MPSMRDVGSRYDPILAESGGTIRHLRYTITITDLWQYGWGTINREAVCR